jgi:hypothetical protein
MSRMRKATEDEKRNYSAKQPKPVYPLHGFIHVGGVACAVERCEAGPDDPKYEVIAPAGHHFNEERLHTLLCYSVADVAQRANEQGLEPCDENC